MKSRHASLLGGYLGIRGLAGVLYVAGSLCVDGTSTHHSIRAILVGENRSWSTSLFVIEEITRLVTGVVFVVCCVRLLSIKSGEVVQRYVWPALIPLVVQGCLSGLIFLRSNILGHPFGALSLASALWIVTGFLEPACIWLLFIRWDGRGYRWTTLIGLYWTLSGGLDLLGQGILAFDDGGQAFLDAGRLCLGWTSSLSLFEGPGQLIADCGSSLVFVVSGAALLWRPRWARCGIILSGALWLALAVLGYIILIHISRELDGKLHPDLWLHPVYLIESIASSIALYVYATRRNRDDSWSLGFCAGCGYNLTGNVSGICPECGTVIEACPASRGQLAPSAGLDTGGA